MLKIINAKIAEKASATRSAGPNVDEALKGYKSRSMEASQA